MKSLPVLAAAFLLTGSLVALTPSASAAATPDWCSGGLIYSPGHAFAYCDPEARGTQVRALVRCYHVTPVGTRDHYTRYGSWVAQRTSPMTKSNAYCATGDAGEGYEIQVR